MNNNSKYFIREDYQPNLVAMTREENDPDYWDEKRKMKAGFSAHDSYSLARALIIESPDIKSIIDIGCGIGTKLNNIIAPLGIDVTGVDQPIPISICKEKYPTIKFIVDDFESGKPNKDVSGKYDLILTVGVIEHLIDPDKLLQYMKHLSHQSTILIIATCDREILVGKGALKPSNNAHVREWTIDEFSDYLQSRSLHIIEKRLDQFLKTDPSVPLTYEYYLNILSRKGQRHAINIVATWK